MVYRSIKPKNDACYSILPKILYLYTEYIPGKSLQSGWAIGFSSPLKTFELHLLHKCVEELKTNLKTCPIDLENSLGQVYGVIYLLN
jgi:hypothetical protein